MSKWVKYFYQESKVHKNKKDTKCIHDRKVILISQWESSGLSKKYAYRIM